MVKTINLRIFDIHPPSNRAKSLIQLNFMLDVEATFTSLTRQGHEGISIQNL
jgi:hypothetical protein